VINLRGLDLNLITVFEAVYEAGSISRAADRLALSQSATSHALARLRDACRDELFIRSAAGITPTQVAQLMYPEVRKSLDGLRRSLAEARGFDPTSSTRRFRVAIPHPAGPIWGLAIADKAKAAAPGVALEFNTRTMPIDPMAGMLSGELDLSVDWLPAEGDRFVNRKLFADELVFVARRGHPRVTQDIDVATLRKERFISTYPRTQLGPDYLQDIRRAYLGLDVAIFVNEALEIPYVVLQTDLIGFIPRSLIRDYGAEVPFQIAPAPIRTKPIPIFLVWHESRRTDAGHEWLRTLTAETVIAVTKR
jgi:DNA-binding transcriptional LysR family regulator